MNSANYVEDLKNRLNDSVNRGEVTVSEAAWVLAVACEGWAYVFGAWGAYCTPGERKQRYSYNNIASILEKCQRLRSSNPKGTCSGCKWYPDGEKTRCFDCRGFEDWLMKMFGFDLQGEGATGQWNTAANWCIKSDDMSAIPQGVMVSVFIWDTSKKNMKHVGYYYNGDTVECSNGVTITKPMKKGRWTHWAVSKLFEKDLKGYTPPAKEPAKEQENVRTLKRGSKGEEVRKVQQMLLERGYKLPKYGADGDFGAETEKAVKQFQKDWGLKQDGIVGPETLKFLEGSPQKVTLYRVIVSGLTEKEAKNLTGAYPGSKMEEET